MRLRRPGWVLDALRVSRRGAGDGTPGRFGAVAFWRRRSRMDVLRRGGSSSIGTPYRSPPTPGGDDGSSGAGPRELRPPLSCTGLYAQGLARESDRAAVAGRLSGSAARRCSSTETPSSRSPTSGRCCPASLRSSAWRSKTGSWGRRTLDWTKKPRPMRSPATEVAPPPVVRRALGGDARDRSHRRAASAVRALKHLSSVHNPEFYEKERLRFSTWNTPRFIRCYRETIDQLLLPRGLREQASAARDQSQQPTRDH